jgi:hypothetical protein
MIHPPTFSHGPLHDHELAELADLLDDIDMWIAGQDNVPEHLRLRVPAWALRLTNAQKAQP